MGMSLFNQDGQGRRAATEIENALPGSNTRLLNQVFFELGLRHKPFTVDALIEATARILVREGFDRASTNRIAEEAGVSVGSLYQYYPCKEALVAAVIDRHNQEIMQVVRGALAEVASQPIEKAVRRLVAVAIEAHRIAPRLHRVLAEQIPRMG